MVAIPVLLLKNPAAGILDQKINIEENEYRMNNTKNVQNSGQKTKLKMIFYFLITFFFTALVVKSFTFFQYRNSLNDFATVQIYDGKSTSKIWKGPPTHEQLYKFARYVMHISEFGSLATISTADNIKNFPFASVFSVSDGPFENSTGVPYFYLTPKDISAKDLHMNKKCSLSVSLAQSDFCSRHKWDPQDPRCSHLIFSGSMVKIEAGSEEEIFAKKALFSRHWEMAVWPPNHAFYFAKIDISNIYILDYFGSAKILDVQKYFDSSF